MYIELCRRVNMYVFNPYSLFHYLHTEDFDIPSVSPITLCWVPEAKNLRAAKTCRDAGRLPDLLVGLSKLSSTKSMMLMMDCLSKRYLCMISMSSYKSKGFCRSLNTRCRRKFRRTCSSATIINAAIM